MINSLFVPQILERKDDRTMSYDLFSRMFEQRIIFLHGEIEPYMVQVAIAELLYLGAKSDDPIKMYINSPGGSVIDGLAVIDTMNAIKAPVYTFCTGMSASMGAVILASGEKGHRYALSSSEIMIHEIASSIHGKFKDMKVNFEHSTRLQDKLYRILESTTGQKYEVIDRECKIDKWFTSHEAKDFGLIDTILEKNQGTV